jgi:peptidyl-prolyl cis-trans isomerase-like protein 2
MKEWTEDFGGKKDTPEKRLGYRPLPFYCCSLSLQPWETPVVTQEGLIYDIT